MFLIDDKKDENLKQILNENEKMHVESTLRQMFVFHSSKGKIRGNSDGFIDGDSR